MVNSLFPTPGRQGLFAAWIGVPPGWLLRPHWLQQVAVGWALPGGSLVNRILFPITSRRDWLLLQGKCYSCLLMSTFNCDYWRFFLQGGWGRAHCWKPMGGREHHLEQNLKRKVWLSE